MTGSARRWLSLAMSGPDSRLRTAAASSLAVSLLGTAGRFVLQVLMAQALGTGSYGQFVTLRGWGELLAVIPNRGYQGAVVRFLPEYEADGRWGRYRAMLRRTLGLTAAGGLALAAGAFLVGGVVTGEFTVSLLLAMATIPVWAALRVLQAVLQAQHRFVPASFIVQVGQPLVLAVGLGIWWLTGRSLGLTTALLLLLLSVFGATGAAARSTLSSTPAAARAASPEPELDRWRPAAREFFLGHIAITITGMADVLILAVFATPTQVALYAIATRISLLGRLVNSGVESIVAPRISSAWGR